MTSNYACISALDLAWEDYKESPSRKDGISDAWERYHRASGCRFIFACGLQLKLDRIVKCTACVFFQSFYMRESMQSCERYQYAAAALYLAAKTNDQKRSLYDVVNVLHVQKNLKRNKRVPNLDKKSSECIHKLNMLKDAELKLSQTLEFEFDIDLPHSVFANRVLRWLKGKFPQNFKPIARKTVILLEYSLHSVVSLLYPPLCISCACVQLAALIENQNEIKIQLPELWYKEMEPRMNEETLDYLINQILSVTEEKARDGYPCHVDYTKMPETERMELERQQQVQRPNAPTVGRKRARIAELDGPAPSPLNYPTPSPHSRGAIVSEWTLYVGNIPTSTSEDQLKEVFSSTGLPVKSVKLMKDRGDRPNRYGFVTFLSKSDMETALIDFKAQEIGGVKISIQRAAVEERNPKRRKQNNVKLKPRPHPPHPHNLFHYPQGPVFGRHSSQWKSLDVFIGYLPPEATEAQIKKACTAAFGRVGRVRINRDPQGRSLGYGFVHFVDQQSKNKALKKAMVQILDGKSCIIKSTKNDQDVQGPFNVRITAFHDNDKPFFGRHISKQLLAKYFMHLGAISEIEMTNQSASIEFYQKQAQEMALSLSGQMISGKNNRKIKIKVEEDWSPKPTGERSVFVPQVDKSVTKQEIFQAFISFGAIESVAMARKENQQKNVTGTRSAIVTYKNRESQIQAIDAKTIVVKNVNYEIKRYKDKHEIENEHKVLVKNIPKDLKEAELSSAMSTSFGPILKLILKVKSGSAIVRFKSRDSVIKACHEARLRISNYVVFIQPFENLVVGRTLHVGNLPKVASENEVQSYFESLLPENHGIQQLKIKMPCVNVIFQTQAQAETAFSAFRDKVFKGNRLDVEFHQRHNNRHNVQDDYAKTIWIAGLKHLKELRKKIEVKCSIMGPVINVNVHKNRKKEDPNGFSYWATVTFDHIESAQKAVAKLNNREFFGSIWTVRPYSAYRLKSPGMGHHQNPMSPGPFGHFGMNPPPHPQFMGPPPPLQHFPKGPMPGNFRSPVPDPRNLPPSGFQGKRKYYN